MVITVWWVNHVVKFHFAPWLGSRMGFTLKSLHHGDMIPSCKPYRHFIFDFVLCCFGAINHVAFRSFDYLVEVYENQDHEDNLKKSTWFFKIDLMTMVIRTKNFMVYTGKSINHEVLIFTSPKSACRRAETQFGLHILRRLPRRAWAHPIRNCRLCGRSLTGSSLHGHCRCGVPQ